ncbi:MAG: GntR family transcriptional regulator [Gemmatimonadota bacterium]|nr:GntR family transcriptional regulator [Gemmatimonadota bacterium]
MPERREEIVQLLRGRVLRGIESGALSPGDRLPSGRDVAAELEADHRSILAAYRLLASEGLVAMRPRGGVYVAAHAAGKGVPPLPAAWLADVLSEGLSRSIPASGLHEWLRRCTETLRLRVAVVATTQDQLHGLCRELRDDFGLEAEHLLVADLGRPDLPLALRRADAIVTTPAHAGRLRVVGAEIQKPVFVIEVRPDLMAGEWALLLRQPVYVVVATVEFGEMIRGYFASTEGRGNLNILVVGRDDVSSIPEGAPTYITQSVRASLKGINIGGRILPPARTISSRSAREIYGFIVDSNIAAMSRLVR